jgi:ketosteroid isomerase-like protein
MKLLARWLPLLCLAGFTGLAGASECRSLASMAWLLGEWKAEGDKSTWRESWAEIGPATWEGRATEASRTNPAGHSTEELRLVAMGGSVFYLAKVAHNELPVPFRLVDCSDGRLVFANAGHDFPRRLEYERQPGGRLHVRVTDGAGKGFTLDFARQPGAPTRSDAVLADEDAHFATMVAADGEAMRRWFTEDLEYVHSTGRVVNRKQMIEELQTGRLRYRVVTPLERHVTFLGADAALVRGQARIEVVADAKPAEFQARYLAVYRREGGDWRLQAWQSLRLP